MMAQFLQLLDPQSQLAKKRCKGLKRMRWGGSIVHSREVAEEVKGNRLPSLEETLAKLSTRPKNQKPQKEVHLEIMPTKKVPNTPPSEEGATTGVG